MLQVAGQAAQAVLDRNQSLAVMAMPDKQSIAQQALGGQAGGTYLAPALYKPVLQARRSPAQLTGASQLLVEMCCRNRLRSMPWRPCPTRSMHTCPFACMWVASTCAATHILTGRAGRDGAIKLRRRTSSKCPHDT